MKVTWHIFGDENFEQTLSNYPKMDVIVWHTKQDWMHQSDSSQARSVTQNVNKIIRQGRIE